MRKKDRIPKYYISSPKALIKTIREKLIDKKLPNLVEN